MTIKSLIVDDEKPARDLLRQYCSDVPFIEIIGECKNAYETIDKLSKEDVSLLFLDIKMPKLSGIQLLRSLNKPPFVIITTAYREYAYEGFELDVTDYLKKPFSYERFLKAVLKVKTNYELMRNNEIGQINPQGKSSEYLFINTDKTIYKILLSELKYVSAMGDYSYFFTNNNKHIAYYSLKKVETLLPVEQFVRVHRSYIVSLNYIDYVEGNMIIIGSNKIPIGKSYKQTFLRMLL